MQRCRSKFAQSSDRLHNMRSVGVAALGSYCGGWVMLIVMRAGSGQGEIEAVCSRARADGLDPEVISDDGRTVIDVSGETPPDLKGAMEMLPGVEAVIRRGTPAP